MGDLKTRPSMRRMLTLPNLTRTFSNRDKVPPKKNLTMDSAQLDTFSEKPRTKSFKIEPKVSKDRRLIETQMINKLKEGVQTEGIFRKSGTKDLVKSLAEMLNEGDIKPWPSDDVIDIAAAYKSYLRLQQNAGNPLFSENDFTKLSSAYKGDSTMRRGFVFKMVFKAMSSENSLRLKEFLDLMAHTARRSEINMMTAHNLAIVTAPNLFPVFSEDLETKEVLDRTQAQQDLVESLILDTMEGRFVGLFR